MNFLLRSTQSSVPAVEAPPPVVEVGDKGGWLESSASWPGALSGAAGPTGFGGASDDDARLVPGSAKMRTRMPIEDHADVPPGDGSILVPFQALSEDWYEAPNVSSLLSLDRPFIFPGEQFHVIIHISVHHPEASGIITPFKVAAAIDKGSQSGDHGSDSQSPHSYQENLDSAKIKTPKSAKSSLKGKWFNTTPGGNLVAVSEWLDEPQSEDNVAPSESQKRRTAMLLESFQNSHFHVKIGKRADGTAIKLQDAVGKPEQLGLSDEEGSDRENPATAHGCRPVVTEDGKFEPLSAGGLARGSTSCWSLQNGDVVVLLQVTMASEFLSNSAELEVLQYEPYVTPPSYPVDDQFQEISRNPTEGLLQWLLPLDRPSSPPPPPAPAPQPALTPSPSGRLSFSGGGNSTFFSFSHVRSSSVGSMSTPAPPPVVTYTPPPPPTYGPEEWGRFLFEKDSQGEVGSEGLLSFRGAALEPQRFSAHCGLPGPYVPGKRWKRSLAILQPVRLESYFADCNTQDLICVLVENSLPATGMTADVVIYVDSVSIVCQSASSGSPPLPVPVACVEVGEDHSLPGLALRPGEQHSFILRPVSQAWKQPMMDDSTPKNRHSHDGQVANLGTIKTRRGGNYELDCGEYAILVSCHCSHTESRLHFKHSLTWRPRPPRDLLLSVALENYSPAKLSSESLAQLTPQVVSVQATNLTSQDMNLTLLAPSSLAASPLSIVSFPGSETPNLSKVGFIEQQQSMTVREVLAMEDESSKPKLNPQLSSRRMSLPPVQPMEMVLGIKPTVLKERIISSSDAAADSGSARTHLWLQSTVPLGRLPPHATTAVRCELLPLTSGIITLDTLHIATNEHDALYIPENSLQVYCTSSLASGVS
ncbi:hypothetical protein M758_5G105200 [Ceratodon purpureus]|nr:hypothetical protein M758_5G105200 [Ceratodon purpureus]